MQDDPRQAKLKQGSNLDAGLRGVYQRLQGIHSLEKLVSWQWDLLNCIMTGPNLMSSGSKKKTCVFQLIWGISNTCIICIFGLHHQGMILISTNSHPLSWHPLVCKNKVPTDSQDFTATVKPAMIWIFDFYCDATVKHVTLCDQIICPGTAHTGGGWLLPSAANTTAAAPAGTWHSSVIPSHSHHSLENE